MLVAARYCSRLEMVLLEKVQFNAWAMLQRLKFSRPRYFVLSTLVNNDILKGILEFCLQSGKLKTEWRIPQWYWTIRGKSFNFLKETDQKRLENSSLSTKCAIWKIFPSKPLSENNLKFPNDCGLLVESIKNLEGRFSENINAWRNSSIIRFYPWTDIELNGFWF